MSLKFKDKSSLLRNSKKIKKDDIEEYDQIDYKDVKMASKTPAQIKFDLIRNNLFQKIWFIIKIIKIIIFF